MDTQHFDQITTTLAAGHNRRGLLQIIGASALSIGGIGILAADEGEARRKRRKKSKKNKKGKGTNSDRCFTSGESCSFDDQCCAKTTNRICDIPHGASNSDKACCGGQGAVCGGVNEDGDAIGPFCCVGSAGVRSFVCSQNDPSNPNVQGTCIPAPVE